MYTNARFRSTGTTSDFGSRFTHNYMNDKTFEKNNNNNNDIVSYPCTKFQLIWRTSDFGTKFTQKI